MVIELTDFEVDVIVEAISDMATRMDEDGDPSYEPFLDAINSVYAKIAAESRKGE